MALSDRAHDFLTVLRSKGMHPDTPILSPPHVLDTVKIQHKADSLQRVTHFDMDIIGEAAKRFPTSIFSELLQAGESGTAIRTNVLYSARTLANYVLYPFVLDAPKAKFKQEIAATPIKGAYARTARRVTSMTGEFTGRTVICAETHDHCFIFAGCMYASMAHVAAAPESV